MEEWCAIPAPRGRKRKLPPCTPSPPFRESSVVKAHEKLSPSQQVTVASFAPIHMRSVSLLGSALGRSTRTLLVLEGLVHSLSLSLDMFSFAIGSVSFYVLSRERETGPKNAAVFGRQFVRPPNPKSFPDDKMRAS